MKHLGAVVLSISLMFVPQEAKPQQKTASPVITPSIQLVGSPDKVDYGDMVFFKVVVDRSRLPENSSTLKYNWIVFENGKLKTDIMVWPDGTQIFFSSGNGKTKKKYTVVLNIQALVQTKQPLKVLDPSGKSLDGAKIVTPDGNTINEIIVGSEMGSPDPIIKEVEVSSLEDPVKPVDPIVPNPTPNPDVPDAPEIPDGAFKVAKMAYNLAMDDKTVSSADRVTAKKLANSYVSVADRIRTSITKQAANVALADSDIKLDPQSILTAIQESNKAALGDKASSWQKWNKLYGDEIYKLYDTKKLFYLTDWETVFRETSMGLNYVK